MIEVNLTSQDIDFAMQIAQLRNQRKVDMGIASKKFDQKQSELGVHFNGLLGEVGAAKALGLDIDVAERLRGDNGTDLVLSNGLTVEVRYRRHREWDFALNGSSLDGMKSDIGLLTWPGLSEQSITVVGWTTRIHLACNGYIMDFGHGPRLVLDHRRMLCMSKMMPLVDAVVLENQA